ncbi:MAG: response regulator transcription factor [Jaaginema sp. PMC 1079.18]|nr:response regulator transcription factor [Jaaginema sp. PMC 1080.18]MEC4854027.1 response regulator transcription factor [Jaaginema sp. PMC 1079.18]MEC4865959.1 response regulator transcription factor [Jaaginema sp. PMC 1078.18]
MSFESPIVKVLVVDDHELMRLTLSVALSQEKSIELVGVASNGQEGIDLAQQHQPHAILMDLQMPMMDGLTAATKIKQLVPNTRIIAYSSVSDPQVEVMVQTAPIDAFCRKETSPAELIAIIQKLAKMPC